MADPLTKSTAHHYFGDSRTGNRPGAFSPVHDSARGSGHREGQSSRYQQVINNQRDSAVGSAYRGVKRSEVERMVLERTVKDALAYGVHSVNSGYNLSGTIDANTKSNQIMLGAFKNFQEMNKRAGKKQNTVSFMADNLQYLQAASQVQTIANTKTIDGEKRRIIQRISGETSYTKGIQDLLTRKKVSSVITSGDELKAIQGRVKAAKAGGPAITEDDKATIRAHGEAIHSEQISGTADTLKKYAVAVGGLLGIAPDINLLNTSLKELTGTDLANPDFTGLKNAVQYIRELSVATGLSTNDLANMHSSLRVRQKAALGYKGSKGDLLGDNYQAGMQGTEVATKLAANLIKSGVAPGDAFNYASKKQRQTEDSSMTRMRRLMDTQRAKGGITAAQYFQFKTLADSGQQSKAARAASNVFGSQKAMMDIIKDPKAYATYMNANLNNMTTEQREDYELKANETSASALTNNITETKARSDRRVAMKAYSRSSSIARRMGIKPTRVDDAKFEEMKKTQIQDLQKEYEAETDPGAKAKIKAKMLNTAQAGSLRDMKRDQTEAGMGAYAGIMRKINKEQAVTNNREFDLYKGSGDFAYTNVKGLDSKFKGLGIKNKDERKTAIENYKNMTGKERETYLRATKLKQLRDAGMTGNITVGDIEGQLTAFQTTRTIQNEDVGNKSTAQTENDNLKINGTSVNRNQTSSDAAGESYKKDMGIISGKNSKYGGTQVVTQKGATKEEVVIAGLSATITGSILSARGAPLGQGDAGDMTGLNGLNGLAWGPAAQVPGVVPPTTSAV